MEILREKYARGEIDDVEFEKRRKKTLKRRMTDTSDNTTDISPEEEDMRCELDGNGEPTCDTSPFHDYIWLFRRFGSAVKRLISNRGDNE